MWQYRGILNHLKASKIWCGRACKKRIAIVEPRAASDLDGLRWRPLFTVQKPVVNSFECTTRLKLFELQVLKNLHLYTAECRQHIGERIQFPFFILSVRTELNNIYYWWNEQNEKERAKTRTLWDASEWGITRGRWRINLDSIWTVCQVWVNPGVGTSWQTECMFMPAKKGGVVQSIKSSRHIKSSKNCDLSRINGVDNIISQFEESSFCRMKLSICRLKGWKSGRDGKMRKEAS